MDRQFCILIDSTGEWFDCSAKHNLLRGIEVLGRKGFPVGCRGGGCVCKLNILGGDYHTSA